MPAAPRQGAANRRDHWSTPPTLSPTVPLRKSHQKLSNQIAEIELAVGLVVGRILHPKRYLNQMGLVLVADSQLVAWVVAPPALVRRQMDPMTPVEFFEEQLVVVAQKKSVARC